MSSDALRFLESVSKEVEFAGGDILFEEDAVADTFYIVVLGRVGLELKNPGRRPVAIQTLGSGDLVGLSWLFPPYRWNWRARAATMTQAAGFDAARVRERCERDMDLRLQLMGVVAEEAVKRLHKTRLQLIDLYQRSQ